MTYEQQGIYRALLDRQWVEGSLPTDLAQLAGLLPKVTAARFAKLWPLISQKFFTRRDGRLINLRLENQRKELDEFCKVQTANSRKAVIARQLRSKKSLPIGKPMDDPLVNQMVTSSSSTSSSTSTVKKEEKTPLDVNWEEFKREYPGSGREGGFMAEQRFMAACARDGYPAVLAGLRRYKQSKTVRDGFVMGMEKWLEKERWIQEAETPEDAAAESLRKTQEHLAKIDAERAARGR